MKYTDQELLYAATARCKCGSGMAHPLDISAAMRLGAWVCSRVLRGEESGGEILDHDHRPFAFWNVRDETSINNRAGYTTRPMGTVAKTVGVATCPKCQHVWESEPYSACGLMHHWLSGPCPNPKCGYSVGGGASHCSEDGEPIKVRYRTEVFAALAQQEMKP